MNATKILLIAVVGFIPFLVSCHAAPTHSTARTEQDEPTNSAKAKSSENPVVTIHGDIKARAEAVSR